MSNIIYLIDRSRVEAREECPRLRYLNYDLESTGIEPEGARLPLLSGIAIHAAHARLLAGQPLDVVVTDIIRDYVAEIKLRGLFGLDVTQDIIREQTALLEGMLRTWAAVRLPRILEEYDVVSIEERFDWQLAPGLVERLRFDVLLRRKDDGLLFILDYKTVSYPSEVWAEKFEHSLQTCLYLQALKERTGEPVGGIIYEGLVKGQYKRDTLRVSAWFGQKVQQSPYTFAYKLEGPDGLSIYQTEYTSKKGYRKVRTFDEMSMKRWVEEWLLPEGKSNELFITVPVINPPAHELLEVKNQVINEELSYLSSLATYNRLVAEGRLQHADALFRSFAPKRSGRCFKYGFDNRCAYVDICFNQGAEPLAEGGGYVRRKPHHDTDLEMVA